MHVPHAVRNSHSDINRAAVNNFQNTFLSRGLPAVSSQMATDAVAVWLLAKTDLTPDSTMKNAPSLFRDSQNPSTKRLMEKYSVPLETHKSLKNRKA